jgi:hypothetical protein
MKKLSLAIGAATILSLGTLATAAQAGERGVHAQVSIQAPMLLAHFDNVPRPVHGVQVVPAYPVQSYRGDHGRHDGYRGDRWEYRRWHGHRGYDGPPPRFYRDRDGDGVPNRYDRRPDNPYRY